MSSRNGTDNTSILGLLRLALSRREKVPPQTQAPPSPRSPADARRRKRAYRELVEEILVEKYYARSPES